MVANELYKNLITRRIYRVLDIQPTTITYHDVEQPALILTSDKIDFNNHQYQKLPDIYAAHYIGFCRLFANIFKSQLSDSVINALNMGKINTITFGSYNNDKDSWIYELKNAVQHYYNFTTSDWYQIIESPDETLVIVNLRRIYDLINEATQPNILDMGTLDFKPVCQFNIAPVTLTTEEHPV